MFVKKKSAIISFALALSIGAAALSGCSQKTVSEETVPETEEEATVATVAVAETTAAASLANVEAEGSLESWELDAAVWSSSNGATVTFTGHPRAYESGQSGFFSVRLDGEEIADTPCEWDGSYYTASVDLEAADGYEYEFVLFSAQGSAENYTLSDAYDALVYMKRSLDAYCNLYISDFKEEDGKFTVTAGWASVQLPQLYTANSAVAFEGAKLEFMLNGETIESKDLTLPEGEGEGSHESSLAGISFTMPEMDDDYQLDLMLVVTLSNGQELTANGGSWFYNNGVLNMAAG